MQRSHLFIFVTFIVDIVSVMSKLTFRYVWLTVLV